MKVLLVSTYELGHQPFGLASPAAWLAEMGAEVNCLDLAVESLDEEVIRAATLIAVYLPMHTATRLASNIVPRIRALNPAAHLCFYGLYAPLNEEFLRTELGAATVLGGEFESGLLNEAAKVKCRTKIGFSKIQPLEVHPHEVGPAEVCALKVGV